MGLKQFHRTVFTAAVVVYLITAWNSTGFHNADEHYQIIEFAQWKLGELDAGKLVWEFDAGIRSSLQPWIAARVFRAAAALGLSDPFVLAALLRLLTAALALAAVRSFVRATAASVHAPVQKAYVLLAYLLWFLPFLLVRFSSEGWSAIFLLWMLAAVLRRGWLWPAQAGILAGIAILCRPPVALVVLSCMAWMKAMRKDAWPLLLKMAGAVAVMLLLGLLLDRAFYGRLVPTTWNYSHMGFTGDPARFDALPWYYYPPWILKYAIPPIGAAILLALVVLLMKRPGHLLVWCTLPFLLAHTLIPHKELRFLFPLAPLVPWLLVEAWSCWYARPQGKAGRMLGQGLAGLVAAANLVALPVVLLAPADAGRKRLVEGIRTEAAKSPAVINYLMDTIPPWAIRVPPFYLPPGVTSQWTTDPCQAIGTPSDTVRFLVADKPLPACMHAPGNRRMVKPLRKPWEAWAGKAFAWEDAAPVWTLYRVDP